MSSTRSLKPRESSSDISRPTLLTLLSLTTPTTWAGHTQGCEPSRRVMERIPLAKPYWDEECERAAIDALSSGRWVKGPQAKQFGEEFAEWCGAISAVPCQSGSAALWAAMRILDIGPGDEVIVPGMTFIATATSVSLVGATPVFADIEEDYWCICCLLYTSPSPRDR